MHRQALIVVLLISVLASCGSGAPPTDSRRQVAQGEVQVEVFASNLEIPWALAMAPDGRFFVSERPGRLRVIVDSRLPPEPVATLPVAHRGEGGLLGLTLHPAFAETGWLYAYYTEAISKIAWSVCARKGSAGANRKSCSTASPERLCITEDVYGSVPMANSTSPPATPEIPRLSRIEARWRGNCCD